MKRYFKRMFAVAAVVLLMLSTCMSTNAASPGSIADKLKDVIMISVNTMLYSNDDFDRTVTFTSRLETINSDEYFSSLDKQLNDAGLSGNVYIYSSESHGDSSVSGKYTFTLRHGSMADLELFTSTLLPGSASELVVNEDQLGPFRDSYSLTETLDYSALCAATSARCSNFSSTYRGFTEVIAEDGTVDSNTFTYSNSKDLTGSSPATFELKKDITYAVEAVSVATDISSSNVVSVAVSLDFADVTPEGADSDYSVGASASSHFKKYVETHPDSPYSHPQLRRESIVGDSSASINTSSASDSTVDTDYRLILRAEGNFESVSEILASVFGSGNSLNLIEGKINSKNPLYDRNSVTHSVDLTKLCADAGFSPSEIGYYFTGSIGSGVKEFSVNGKPVEVDDNTAVGSASGAVFNVLIDYEALDISALIVTVLICAALLCLAAFIAKLLRRRSGKKRKIKSDDVRYEAVKSVALALVPEQDRANTSMHEVPSELLNRPTVVIKPKSDDGLDDDDDDPEGIILFSMMLRILLTVQLVLFFFPYFNVTKDSILDTVTNFSGLDLFLGKALDGTLIEPNRFVIVLFVLPLVMLICLMARRVLPKLALPLAISAGSVFCVFYLIDLKNNIYDHLSPAIEAATSTGTFVSQPASQTGYDYSLVIYLVLAIGGIVLLLSNIMAELSRRRHKRDEEMLRFEK